MVRIEDAKVHFTDPVGEFPHKTYDMENALLDMVQKARRSISIMSYSLPTYDSSWFLYNSLKKGITKGLSINVYAHSNTEVHRLVNSFAGYQKIKGWYWNADATDLFHIKAIIVDSRYVYIGSANLSKNAISNSAEWGVISDSPDLAIEINRYLRYLVDSMKLIEV